MGGAGTEDAITSASRGVSERVASLRSYDWTSSNPGISTGGLVVLRSAESVTLPKWVPSDRRSCVVIVDSPCGYVFHGVNRK